MSQKIVVQIICRASTSFLSVKNSGYSRLDENQGSLRTFGSRSCFL